LIGVINEGLDSSSAGIGKIEILKKFAHGISRLRSR